MWYFKELNIGTPERNPRETEFFKQTLESDAIIREFIQNALDARQNRHIVEIKITIKKLKAVEVRNYFDQTLKEHLLSCGLITKDKVENIECLILEDFGTTGLDGPIDPDSGTGNFYNFWWREGISEKRGKQTGRWGLGKTTYHMFSKIKTFWGLTIRNDGKKLLMGKSLLKPHIVDKIKYDYFGYYCQNNYFPIENQREIESFMNTFSLTRKMNEPGLSIIIPFTVDKDIIKLIIGTIDNYYYPILEGILKFSVYINNKPYNLTPDNIINDTEWIINNYELPKTHWNNQPILNKLNFARESIVTNDEIVLNCENLAINTKEFENYHNIKESFHSNKLIKFKIKFFIQKKGTDIQQDTFVTFIMRKITELANPIEDYIRSGILIPQIKKLKRKNLAILLIAEDDVISEFLGDCEDPGHTNWNERTEGFTSKYENAVKTLRFIKSIPYEIIKILDEPQKDKQTDFLKDIFFISNYKSPRSVENNGHTPLNILTSNPLFYVTDIMGGFKIVFNSNVKNDNNVESIKVGIQVAYDTRRGNPFKLYQKFDFDLNSNNFIFNFEQCKILAINNNEIEIEIFDKNFSFSVQGFDPNRDLIINIFKK